jgi:hypothetical protein
MRLALFALVLLACGSSGEAPSVGRSDSQDASAADENALPAAPDTPGCAMTIDGEPSSGSEGAARLTRYMGGPWLRLFCGEVTVDVPRPRGGDVQHGAATFSRYGAEYRGSCDVRLDKLAIRDRGGLAARVRCDLSLFRVLRQSSFAHPPQRRAEGYLVLPKATDLPAPRAYSGDTFCTYETTGDFVLEGRGHAFSNACTDERFTLGLVNDYAAIYGSFCPTCTTYYEGTCTRSNVEERGRLVISDVTCALNHELAGELHVKAHLEGNFVLVP